MRKYLGAILSVAQVGRKKSPIGVVGALPGVPEETEVKAPSSPKSVEKEKLLKRYDRAFSQLRSRGGANSRAEALERMRPVIYELSPEIKAWTGDMRIRACLLMKEIAKNLDDPESAKAGLALLVLILSKGGSSAMEIARPIFMEKVRKMYLDPKHENERFLPRLLLMLEDYEPKRVERLAKEAIHIWPDSLFSAAGDYLGFDELAQRGLRKSMKGLLGGEIAKAGLVGDRTALNRAVELYHQVT